MSNLLSTKELSKNEIHLAVIISGLMVVWLAFLSLQQGKMAQDNRAILEFAGPIVQANDGSGYVSFGLNASNLQNNNCQLKVEYSVDNGLFYKAIIHTAQSDSGQLALDNSQEFQISNLNSATGEAVLHLIWDSKSADNTCGTMCGNIASDKVKLKVTSSCLLPSAPSQGAVSNPVNLNAENSNQNNNGNENVNLNLNLNSTGSNENINSSTPDLNENVNSAVGPSEDNNANINSEATPDLNQNSNLKQDANLNSDANSNINNQTLNNKPDIILAEAAFTSSPKIVLADEQLNSNGNQAINPDNSNQIPAPASSNDNQAINPDNSNQMPAPADLINGILNSINLTNSNDNSNENTNIDNSNLNSNSEGQVPETNSVISPYFSLDNQPPTILIGNINITEDQSQIILHFSEVMDNIVLNNGYFMLNDQILDQSSIIWQDAQTLTIDLSSGEVNKLKNSQGDMILRIAATNNLRDLWGNNFSGSAITLIPAPTEQIPIKEKTNEEALPPITKVDYLRGYNKNCNFSIDPVSLSAGGTLDLILKLKPQTAGATYYVKTPILPANIEVKIDKPISQGNQVNITLTSALEAAKRLYKILFVYQDISAMGESVIQNCVLRLNIQ